MLDNYFNISFILTIYALTVLEIKRLNTVLTPFTVCAWPFLIIVTLNNFVLKYLDYHPVTIRAQLFLLSNFVMIWLVGYLLSYKYKDQMPAERKAFDSAFVDLAKYQPIIIGVSIIVIWVTINKVSGLISQMGGIDFFTTQEFEDKMISGIGAHFIEVGKICFVLLIFTYKSTKYKIFSLVTLFGLFLAISIVQVKYHLIWVLLITFFFLNFNYNIKHQIKNVIKIGFVLILTMNMFWIFLIIIWGSIGTKSGWDFLLGHTFVYFVSGPIVLDHWLDFSSIKPDWTIFSVFLNVKNVILGHPLRINPVPLTHTGFIEVAPGHISNVGTSFGVYYLIGGFLFTIFTTFILSLVSYSFFFKSICSNNKFFIFFNLLFLTITSLNSFGQYFTALSFYETIVLYSLMVSLLMFFNKINKLTKASPSTEMIFTNQ